MNFIPEDELDLSEEMKKLEEKGNKDRREEGDAESYIDKCLKAADIARYVGDNENFYKSQRQVGWQLKVLAESASGEEETSYAKESVKHYFQAGEAAEKNHNFDKALDSYEKAADVSILTAKSKAAEEQLGWYGLADELYRHSQRVAEKQGSRKKVHSLEKMRDETESLIEEEKRPEDTFFDFGFLMEG